MKTYCDDPECRRGEGVEWIGFLDVSGQEFAEPPTLDPAVDGTNKEHVCPGSCTKSVGGKKVWSWEVHA